MADSPSHAPRSGGAAPADWRDAFAALPREAPPADGWMAVSRRLDAGRRRRRWQRALPLAAAAALLLALAPAWLQRPVAEPSPATAMHSLAGAPAGNTTSPATDAGTDSATLAQLQVESARLEALLRYARDGRVASGTAAAMAAELDERVATIDAALMQPTLDTALRLRLWRERVEVLRSYAGFESTRRWLAAQGRQYEPALAYVD